MTGFYFSRIYKKTMKKSKSENGVYFIVDGNGFKIGKSETNVERRIKSVICSRGTKDCRLVYVRKGINTVSIAEDWVRKKIINDLGYPIPTHEWHNVNISDNKEKINQII